MTTKELTCVVCPAGCKITVTLDENKQVVSVEGNTCLRGKTYASNEVTHPVRTLTSTVPVETKNGRKMLPCRTDKPIPKESLFEAMELLRRYTAQAPVKTGEKLIENFIEDGISLVACKDFD